MHNQYNTILRKCFGLDDMEQQLTNDFNEMSTQVQTAIALEEQKLRKNFEEKYSWLTWLVTGFAAAVLWLQVVTIIHAFTRDNVTVWEWITAPLTVAVLILAALWRRQKEKIKR